MFEHFLAGELVFLFLGKFLGFKITTPFLIFGAFCGFFPDLLSYFLNKQVRYDKWYHSHRDNFSHSIFLPIVFFVATSFWLGWQMSLLISLAMLTHPLLDLYGLGWGVKLFLPFSDDIYKLFHKKKILYIYENNKERNSDVEKHQSNDWFRNIYLRFGKMTAMSLPHWWGVFEWLSLLIFILLAIYPMLGK
ncbi:MAG: metal-dependent hydrolase [Patescibacteria group bacterium]|jgi:hypothetical protein